MIGAAPKRVPRNGNTLMPGRSLASHRRCISSGDNASIPSLRPPSDPPPPPLPPPSPDPAPGLDALVRYLRSWPLDHVERPVGGHGVAHTLELAQEGERPADVEVDDLIVRRPGVDDQRSLRSLPGGTVFARYEVRAVQHSGRG